jgi:3-phytase
VERTPRGCDRQPGFALDVRAHLLLVLAALFAVTCSSFRHAGTAGEVPVTEETGPDAAQETAVAPVLVTEPVVEDSDDPAIWLHPEDPSRSLVIGTDKGGYLFVFDLEGRIIAEKTVSGLGRMNNVDVEYGLMLDGVPTDIAVATERPTSKLRIYRLPEMTPVDGGGVEVFADQAPANRPMGVALFKRRTDGAVFAIVSRKEGPSGSYLWQYRLHDDGDGRVTATKVREFGAWSGVTEIEAVAVDDVLGYVYYSDESTGIRKYHADPDAPGADEELALFGTTGFTGDREGISIYRLDDGAGYILVSDQQANEFRVFTREGTPGNPHEHRFLKAVRVSTNESDGSEVCGVALNDSFPSGLFVAMSDDRTFHFYSWADIAGEDLLATPSGAAP